MGKGLLSTSSGNIDTYLRKWLNKESLISNLLIKLVNHLRIQAVGLLIAKSVDTVPIRNALRAIYVSMHTMFKVQFPSQKTSL